MGGYNKIDTKHNDKTDHRNNNAQLETGWD
jgi:hypothetical protein